MATYVQDFHRRFRRARKHLKDFERQSTLYLTRMQEKVVTEIDSDGVNQFLRVMVKGIKEPPPNLSFIIGDCIHNLRSVLDNLVWQLGNVSGCPRTVLRHLKFPVCGRPADFNARAAKLKSFDCFPQAAIDIIESLQPYQPYKGRDDPDSHPLRILNSLWNDDKHRSPALMLVSVRSTAFSPMGPIQTRLQGGRRVQYMEFRPPAPVRMTVGGRLQDGQTIITIPFRIGEPEPQFKAMVSFDIAFDEGGPAKGKYASKCLRNLYNFVRDEVLTPFEPIFPKYL